MAVSAGDAFLDIHSRLAANFGRQLTSQVQGPVNRAGEQASHHFGRSFARGLKTASVVIGAGLATATVLATRGLLATTKAASDLNETINKTNVIFGKSSPAIQKWAQGSAKALGLSRNEALTNAASFGDMFRQLGLGLPVATNMSTKMVGLASDLASFSNADITQVLEAQQSAFRGEYDALQRFIPNINAARVEQEALRETHKKSAKDLTAAEKAQATYSIMLKDSTRAQGDFARTSDGLANQQRIAKAQWEDLKTTIGQGFLPAQLAVTAAFNSKVLPALKVLATNYGPKAGAVVTRLATAFADSIPSAKELGNGLDALSAAFHGEGITTQAGTFVGTMERLGVKGRQVVDWAHSLGPALARIGRSFTQLFQSSSQVGPALQSAGGGGHVFANSLMIIGPVLDVVARNLHNILPWLPTILAGFLAFRAIKNVTAPLVQIGELISNIAAPFRIAALFAQNAALKAHTAALVENTAATRGNAVSQELATGASNAGILATIRARAAMIGQAIAAKAVAAASKAWAAVQWLVNAALTANPIGIVVVAIAALVAGIVIAYKKSETFRNIVQGVFKTIMRAVLTAVNFIIGLLKGWLDVQFDVVAGILHIMGKLPGPMGAPFRAAEKAVRGAKRTVDDQITKIQNKINSLKGKNVTVSVQGTIHWDKNAALLKSLTGNFTHKLPAFAKGGRIPGYGGGDRVPIMAEPGEAVVPKDKVRTAGFQVWAKAEGIPGFQRGGIVGALAKLLPFRNADADALRYATRAGLDSINELRVRNLGGGSAAIKAFIRSTDPLPYIWGGVGPGGYDCSGLTGEVLNRMQRRPSYHRRFTTASNFGALGFKPGVGVLYTIGVTAGRGHMVGRYGGLGFEAESTRTGIKVGAAATRPESMARQYHFARGGLVKKLDPRTVEWLAHQPGIVIGGDPAKLRIDRYDQGGMLPPGRMAINTTGRPEALGFDYDKMAEANVRAMKAAGLGAVYLDGRRVDRQQATAQVLNARRR